MIRESNYGVQWVGERKGGDGVSRSVVSRRRDLAGGGVFASALAPLGTQQVILPGASVRDHMMAEGSGPKDEPDGPGTSFRIVVLDLRRRGGDLVVGPEANRRSKEKTRALTWLISA